MLDIGAFLPYYSFRFNNWGATPSSAMGTSVTSNATANVEGSWTQIAASSDITSEVYWLNVRISHGYSSGASRPSLLDIGVDPAGGTSYVEQVQNLICGNSADFTTPGGGHCYHIPIRIRAGSSVAVRLQSGGTTVPTRVSAMFFGDPSRPEMAPNGTVFETIGTVTNSLGVSFTPGNTGTYGSWVSLGTTTRELWWWQLGAQVDNATQNALGYRYELAYGDASNKTTILINAFNTRSTESSGHIYAEHLMSAAAYCLVPAGSTIYVRGTCTATADTGHNALAYGVGG